MGEIGGRLPLEGKPSGGRCEQEPLNGWHPPLRMQRLFASMDAVRTGSINAEAAP